MKTCLCPEVGWIQYFSHVPKGHSTTQGYSHVFNGQLCYSIFLWQYLNINHRCAPWAVSVILKKVESFCTIIRVRISLRPKFFKKGILIEYDFKVFTLCSRDKPCEVKLKNKEPLKVTYWNQNITATFISSNSISLQLFKSVYV